MGAAAIDVVNAWYYRQMALWAGLFRKSELELEYWERVRALRPRDTGTLAAIANRRAAQGDRHGAIAVLEHSVQVDPGVAHAWFNLGFLRQELGEHEAACEAFERAVALDPKLDRAWYGKGLSLVKLGRVDDAVVALKKVVELQPMSPYGFYQLAHAYHRLGQADRVVAIVRRLSKFEPKVALQLERETGVHAGIEDPFDPGAGTARRGS